MFAATLLASGALHNNYEASVQAPRYGIKDRAERIM
jgi:hypothetical protein